MISCDIIVRKKIVAKSLASPSHNAATERQTHAWALDPSLRKERDLLIGAATGPPGSRFGRKP